MKIIIAAILLLVSITSFAEKYVPTSQMEYIYQLDSSPTEFEFSISTPNFVVPTYIRRIQFVSAPPVLFKKTSFGVW